jgi:predicted DNA-binding transcriptional regulator AlpA
MIETMTASNLVGLTEIGKMFDITRQRAYTISKKRGFPAPIDTLSSGRVWDRAEIEKWGETWDRANKGGRPPAPKPKPPAEPDGP